MLEELPEGFVLFGGGLDDLREMQKLVALFGIEEVGQSLRPGVLILDQDLNELLIIFKLRVNNLDVLVIFSEEVPEILEALLDSLG